MEMYDRSVWEDGEDEWWECQDICYFDGQKITQNKQPCASPDKCAITSHRGGN